VDGPITFEYFDFDRSIFEEFDFPSFAWNGDLYEDGLITSMAKTVIDFSGAKVVQEREKIGGLRDHLSNLWSVRLR
jgi:hypothetical protein